jgi:hypothetical protein
VAGHLPAPLRDAAQSVVQTSFMTGLHRGSLVAAGATLAAALMALVFVPARAAAAADPEIYGTGAADSVRSAPTVTVRNA